MKKLIMLILCVIGVKAVNASVLNYEYLPYYFKVNTGNYEEIIQLKKIYDKETNDVLFNVDLKNYEVTNHFEKFNEINRDNFGSYFRSISTFNNIVYYGYTFDKSDENYYYTQLLIWNLVGNNSFSVCDKNGNVIDEKDEKFKELWNNSMLHNMNSDFYYQTFERELWTFDEFLFNRVVLDYKELDGLILKKENDKLSVYADKVGSYKIDLYKNYDSVNFAYNDGVNYYWYSNGMPANIEKYFKYNVYGTEFIIKENLIGVNNHFGDALTNSKYELYYNDELKLKLQPNILDYVRSNSKYIIKDLSESNGFYKNDDIEINVLNDKYELVIDKYVISKNITIDIKTEDNYYVYLKSNNELYETINKDIDLITLPYGTYIVFNNDKSYYEELKVLDNIDDVLVIEHQLPNDEEEKEIDNNTNINDNESDEVDDIVNKNNIQNNEMVTDNKEDKEEIKNGLFDETIENPQTGAPDYMCLILLSIAFSSLLGLIIIQIIKMFKN